MTITAFFESNGILFLPESSGKELRIVCPFCSHVKQKCYVHSDSGVYYCFHCGVYGSFPSLTERLNLIAKDVETTKYIPNEEEYPLSPIDPEIIEENQRNLTRAMENKELSDYLHIKRGYTDETIKKFKLGWDGRNITIPVFQSNGDCINFKLKPDPTRPTAKSIMYNIPGRGRKQLFNEKVLGKKLDRVIVCEGEWDCMMLSQFGYDAVTSTAGANSFDKSWIDAFERCEKIYLLFDNDMNSTGQQAAIKTAQMFYEERGFKAWIIQLPGLVMGELKLDITDFITKRKKEKPDVTNLLKEAKQFMASLQYGQWDFVSHKELKSMEFPADQWIVEHFLPEQSICCVAGLPGTMKSYFTNYIASCISQGLPLLDRFKTKQVPILFIDKENRLARIQSRFNLLGTPDQEQIYFLRGDFFFEDASSLAIVENFIVSHNIKLVIMDTLVRMHSKAENDASEMNKVFHGLHRLTTAGATVLFIHHFKKNNLGFTAVGDIRDMLRGSGDILAQLDTYFALQRVEGGFLKCEFGKSRDEGVIKPFLIEAVFNQDATYFNYLKEIEPDDNFQTVAHEDVIYSIIKQDNFTIKQIFNKVEKAMSIATLKRCLGKLRESGRVTTFTNNNKEYVYTVNRDLSEVN